MLKSKAALFFMLTLLVSNALLAREQSECTCVIPFQHMSEQRLQDFMNGQCRGIIVEIEKGTQLPLHVSLQGSLIALEEIDPSQRFIKILQTTYARYEESGLQLSLDGVHWLPCTDFFTGEICFQIHVKEEIPGAFFNATLNPAIK